jgi:hypothetical protein
VALHLELFEQPAGFTEFFSTLLGSARDQKLSRSWVGKNSVYAALVGFSLAGQKDIFLRSLWVRVTRRSARGAEALDTPLLFFSVSVYYFF